MPRTVNPRAHGLRREAFLDAAQRLIQTKGYEAMSIQDVLDALQTSRGALYHYFDSKQELLEGVVQRLVDGALASLAPLLHDPRLPAPRKLELVFAGIARWKAGQKELVLALIPIWQSDANAIVREKIRRLTVSRLVPLLAGVIGQGIDEGAFTASSAEGTAMAVGALLQAMQDWAVTAFLERQRGLSSFEAVRRSAASLTESLERVLGADLGSLTLMDEPTLRFWFD
ncbi:MAG: TetR/AcrR family transcriptional regulator [Chloroflexota bacterium]